MKIQTCLVIPGLDAIFSKESALRWLEDDVVKETFKEASSYLRLLTGEEEDLYSFYKNEKRAHIKDFDRTLISLTTLQVAIVKSTKLDQELDMIVSCSHGDIARSVIAGVITLGEAVGLLWYFSKLRHDVQGGYTANVRRWDKGSLEPHQIDWLKERGMSPSVWGPKNVTVATKVEDLEEYEKKSDEVGLKISKTLPYPVHSPLMHDAASKLLEFASPLNLGATKCKVFSTIRLDWLKTDEDFRQECYESSVSPVRWLEAFEYLNTKLEISRLINIGPSNNLISLVFEDTRFDKNKLIDAYDLRKTK